MGQYFQIFDDRIVEVRCDGQPVLSEEKVPRILPGLPSLIDEHDLKMQGSATRQ